MQYIYIYIYIIRTILNNNNNIYRYITNRKCVIIYVVRSLPIVNELQPTHNLAAKSGK